MWTPCCPTGRRGWWTCAWPTRLPVRPGLVEKYREEDAAPILVDRERIRAMGLELEEYPVASEGGDYARHDPDRLAAAVLDVYRRRAVRIFRGEQRYIIEE